MLDIGAYNAYVLYSIKYLEFLTRNKSRSRRAFIKEPVKEIVDTYNGEMEFQRTAAPLAKRPSFKGRCTP